MYPGTKKEKIEYAVMCTVHMVQGTFRKYLEDKR